LFLILSPPFFLRQMLFGSGADVVPSEVPVRVRLPTMSSGAEEEGGGEGAAAKARQLEAMLRQTRGAQGGPTVSASASGSDSDSDGEAQRQQQQQWQQGPAGSVSSGDSSDGNDDGELEAEGGPRDGATQRQRQQGAAPALAPGALDPDRLAAGAAYGARDAAGAPCPLQPELVTLSMLPRTQWQNLVHLDAIKARNKPIEPPKKPAAAPFFLPTLAGANAGRNPVFDFAEAADGGQHAAEAAQPADSALAARAAAAWGDSEAEEAGERPQNGAADAAGSGSSSDDEGQGAAAAARRHVGRVLRTRAQPERSRLTALLHGCAAAGDWTSLVAYLRGLPPVALDAELRGMQVVKGAEDEAALADVALLLRFLEDEVAAHRNFEFVQVSVCTPVAAACCSCCRSAAAAAASHAGIGVADQGVVASLPLAAS
jgi:U3 small nucleolar RNA-associated protein 21